MLKDRSSDGIMEPGADAAIYEREFLGEKNFPSTMQVSRPCFTATELKFLHSFTIPLHKKLAYNQRKHQIFQHAAQVVKALKFPLRVLSTSMNYFQRYYLFNKFEEPSDGYLQDLEKDPFTVLITCLFLASKNEDCIKKLRDIQSVSTRIRDVSEENKLLSNTSFNEAQRKAVLTMEFKLLQVIKFDFSSGSTAHSIDQLVVRFGKKLSAGYKTTMFSWLICYDIMSTPLCLMIPPHCIALAIIIVALNINPKDMYTNFNKADDTQTDLNEILENLDCYNDFQCPESLVNEGILYILDYYVHQMNYSVLNNFMPAVDLETGKERTFKFMELKTRFNDLKGLSERSCDSPSILRKDEYLQLYDYNIASRGASRFLSANKRRRFDKELDLNTKENGTNGISRRTEKEEISN